MAAITASMVAELRAKTDAPMMECKKALTEADGDLARAEELLRVKLGNKASKAAIRAANRAIRHPVHGVRRRPAAPLGLICPLPGQATVLQRPVPGPLQRHSPRRALPRPLKARLRHLLVAPSAVLGGRTAATDQSRCD